MILSCVPQFDRAIIDFGNVTNTFTDQNDESASAIIITWDAVMIQNDNTVHDAVYWVSAGAEYNYEMEVFVAQASFTAKTDPEVRFEYGTAGIKKKFLLKRSAVDNCVYGIRTQNLNCSCIQW